MQPRVQRIVHWVAVGLLVALFAWQGSAKLLALDFEVRAFERWGYPSWFMYVVGSLEVAGVIGLLIPRLRPLAALGLVGLMVGAIATHVRLAEWAALAMPVVAMLLAAWLAWEGRASIPVLNKMVRRIHG